MNSGETEGPCQAALAQEELGERSRGGVRGFKKKRIAWKVGFPLHLPKTTLQPLSTGNWMLLGSTLVKPLSSSHCP